MYETVLGQVLRDDTRDFAIYWALTPSTYRWSSVARRLCTQH